MNASRINININLSEFHDECLLMITEHFEQTIDDNKAFKRYEETGDPEIIKWLYALRDKRKELENQKIDYYRGELEAEIASSSLLGSNQF